MRLAVERFTGMGGVYRKPIQRLVREIVALVEAFGFRHVRTSGSHHVFIHADVSEPINIQSVHGKTKPYQVRQFLEIVERYSLTLRSDT